MGQTLAAWETRVKAILGNPDVARLPVQDLDDAIKGALRRYGKDRPRALSADYAGNGSTFDLAVPASWINGFSGVMAVEYPQGQRPAVFLDLAEVGLYPDVLAPTFIRLNFTTPATGQTAR